MSSTPDSLPMEASISVAQHIRPHDLKRCAFKWPFTCYTEYNKLCLLIQILVSCV